MSKNYERQVRADPAGGKDHASGAEARDRIDLPQNTVASKAEPCYHELIDPQSVYNDRIGGMYPC